MPGTEWPGENDHDRLIRQEEIIRGLQSAIKSLQDDNRKLMEDRAKLIGWCGGVSGATAIIVKLFWPHG